MLISDLKKSISLQKKIVIRGLGVEGVALARWLVEYLAIDPRQVILSDHLDMDKLIKNPLFKELISDYQFTTLLGIDFAKYLDRLSEICYVFKSPGIWNLGPEFQQVRSELGETAVQGTLSIFIERFASRTIAVTGTKGKTTTCNYLMWILGIIQKNHLLSPIFSKCHRIGNTANVSPYTNWTHDNESELEKDLFILEISSFQLQDLAVAKPSFWASVITNYFIDHQDMHQGPKEYWGSKDVVFKFSIPKNLVCTKSVCEHTLSSDLIQTENILTEDMIQAIDRRINNPLRGEHNKSNMALAFFTIFNCYQIPQDQTLKFIDQYKDIFNKDHREFKNSPHRLEFIGRIKVASRLIECFDDGAGTNPEATLVALKTLLGEGYKLILILGGKTKLNDYQQLRQFIVSNLDDFYQIFCSGEVREVLNIPPEKLYKKIAMRELFDNLLPILNDQISREKDLESQKLALLFSPSGASFDEFSSYSHRADYFVRTILSQSSKLNS